MHYFISYRDSSIIYCIDKVMEIFAKVNTDAKAEDGEKERNMPWQKSSATAAIFEIAATASFLDFHEDDESFSERRGYTISCYYELPEMFIPYDAPF
jgi:hypothetical protein